MNIDNIMGYSICAGNTSLRWSYNWYVYREIFNIKELFDLNHDETMEYLNYRIYWLREQGFNEKQTDLNHFGGKYITPTEKKNTYVSYWDNIEKNEFILLSTLLSELIYLKHLCSISLYGKVVMTDNCDSNSITKRDIIKQVLTPNIPATKYFVKKMIKQYLYKKFNNCDIFDCASKVSSYL
jgi:hypothetical protein